MKKSYCKVSIHFLVVSALLLSLLCSCSFDRNLADHYLFTDSLGRQVNLPLNIDKVAPSGMVATMILYAVAPNSLASVDRMPAEIYQKYYSKEYLSLPVTGQIYGITDLNPEALIELAPDVIIDLGDKKENMKQELDALQEQTGIPVIFIQATLENYPEAFRTLGKLLGQEEQGDALAKYTEETLSRSAKNREEIHENDPYRVMFGTGESGLDCNAKGSVHSSVLEVIGLENAIVVPEVNHKGGGNTITMEELMVSDPDIILLDVGGPYSSLADDPYWSGLTAVQEDHFYEIPCGPFFFLAGPPSINQIIGIDWLGNLLYPQLYSFDLRERVSSFYKLFWHYSLSSEEIDDLFKNSTYKELSDENPN